MSIITIETINNMLESAFILGLTPLFVIENIFIDKVVTPEPVVKKLTIKSSRVAPYTGQTYH